MSATERKRCPYCFAPITANEKACSPEHAKALNKPDPDPRLSRSEVAAILKRGRERRAASQARPS